MKEEKIIIKKNENSAKIINYFAEPEESISYIDIDFSKIPDDKYKTKTHCFFQELEKNNEFFLVLDDDGNAYFECVAVMNAEGTDYICIPLPIFAELCGEKVSCNGVYDDHALGDISNLLHWQCKNKLTWEDIQSTRNFILDGIRFDFKFRIDEINKNSIKKINLARVKEIATLTSGEIKKIENSGFLDHIDLGISIYDDPVVFSNEIMEYEFHDQWCDLTNSSIFIFHKDENDIIGFRFEDYRGCRNEDTFTESSIDIRSRYAVGLSHWNYDEDSGETYELLFYIPKII